MLATNVKQRRFRLWWSNREELEIVEREQFNSRSRGKFVGGTI